MREQDDFAFRAVHEWKTLAPEITATDDEMALLIRLSRVLVLKDRIDEHSLRPFEHEGVRGPEDFRTLALLRRKPDGLSNNELIEQLGGSKGGMSARLERFAKHGLCERKKSEVDRRSQSNTVTPRGAEITDRLVIEVLLGRKTLLQGLQPDEVKALATLLGSVIEQVDPGG